MKIAAINYRSLYQPVAIEFFSTAFEWSRIFNFSHRNRSAKCNSHNYRPTLITCEIDTEYRRRQYTFMRAIRPIYANANE